MNQKDKELLKSWLRSDFREVGYDSGFENQIDNLIKDSFNNFGVDSMMEFLYEFLVEEFGNSYLNYYYLECLLFVFHRIDEKYITEKIYNLIFNIANSKNPNIVVVENCIECFEHWNNKKSLNLLQHLKIDIKWLEDYRLKVIENIKEYLNEL